MATRGADRLGLEACDPANAPSTAMVDPEAAERQDRILDSSKKILELADTLIPELELFLSRLKTAKGKQALETGLPLLIRSLRGGQAGLLTLASELSTGQIEAEALSPYDRKLESCASLISYVSMQWQILKRCRSFVAINKTFQGASREERRRKVDKMKVAGRDKERMQRLIREQSRVDVEVVAAGHEWICIKTLPPERLARQMAEAGWGWGEHELGETVDAEEWEDLPLAKQVRKLVAAARTNRHEYRPPRVRLVLPNISRENKEFGVLLEQLAKMDPLVKVAIEDVTSDFILAPPPEVDVAIENLLGDDLEGLTMTVNLDHTILIDLVSDLTHMKLEPQPWQYCMTKIQIEQENQHAGGLMAKTLYPILQGRTLVCTREAAEHFHYVLKMIGTETERERARLIAPLDEEAKAMTPESIRSRFQALSIHPIPDDVQLPIRILTTPWTMPTIKAAVSEGTLPRMALDVADASKFKSAKLSIFMYGWAAGVVTVASNREIKGQMRKLVEEHRKEDGDVGPLIWRVDVTRNLLAKHASPRPGNQKEMSVEEENNDESEEG